MARHVSRFVIASRLEAEFLPGCVKHRYPQHTPSQSQLAEEVWFAESTIGRGTFGVVRIERRRDSRPEYLSSSPELRAVKEISKSVDIGQRWDYMKELEAIVQFSLPRYAPYFVRSNGWFENDESIFIAMEYFPLGDLRRFMDNGSRFTEDSTQQIVRQLLKGIRFMHESGFAHRDLKPGNILVASVLPRWIVKIADFGISKQSMEGTHLRTMQIGTLGYMAPEVFGFHANNNPTMTYSVSVDIWAIGVITIELLLKKHPLPTFSDLSRLIHGGMPLITDTALGLTLSEDCRDFVRQLLNTDPITRLKANTALLHSWLGEVIPDSEDEEPLFVPDDPLLLSPLSQALRGATPISLPSLAWSNLQLSDRNTSTTQSSDMPLNTYHGPAFDSSLLLPSLQGFPLETHKYFVLRSDNPIDIETSVAHNVWTSSSRVNKMLEKAWNKTGGQVILFFSVIKSQKFCGIAQMTSNMDWVNTDEHWVEDSWRGRFTLNWLCLTELPFAGVKHIPVSSRTPGFRAIACYDGTEISAPSAFELLKAFSAWEREHVSSFMTPPATLTAMSLDTIRGSALPETSSRNAGQRHNSVPQSNARRDTNERDHLQTSLGFGSILRAKR